MLRRLAVLMTVVCSLMTVAVPAIATEPDPLCLVRPAWCE